MPDSYHDIFDTHAHYDDAKFDSDREQVVSSLATGGVVGVINCATEPANFDSSRRLCAQYPFFYCAFGVHPEDIDAAGENWLDLTREAASYEKCVAIGEIGLDYHWRKDNSEAQKEVFARQLELARELDLPVIIHDREAHADVLELCRKYRPKGVLHSFSGSAELAEEYLAMGMYIGVGGSLTYQYAKKQPKVAAVTPMSRVLLETDAPYSSPEPHRGERNTSLFIPAVAQRIGEIKGLDAQSVISQAHKNALELFGIRPGD
ncbi:MAG: TatD family hydrolase [Clostridia bacterium]|nr:TatD family hydrolase [Clostridia bacterium]